MAESKKAKEFIKISILCTRTIVGTTAFCINNACHDIGLACGFRFGFCRRRTQGRNLGRDAGRTA